MGILEMSREVEPGEPRKVAYQLLSAEVDARDEREQTRSRSSQRREKGSYRVTGRGRGFSGHLYSWWARMGSAP